MTRLHDIEIDPYLYESVTVDADRLEEVACKTSSNLAYWNELLAKSHADVGRLKQRLEILGACLDQEARVRLQDFVDEENAKRQQANAKARASELLKVTEAQVKAAVVQEASLQSLQLELIEAEAEKSRLWGILDALRAKRDVIVGLLGVRRAELADPVTRELTKRHKLREQEDQADSGL